MAVPANLTMTENLEVTARAIDFVTRFQQNWDALRDIMGIMRPIPKVPGTMLKSKKASITLQSGAVAEGDEIPYSQATVTEVDYDTIDIEKYRKGVTIEAINNYGYDVAVAMTDEALLNELQANVMDRFYTYLNTGTLKATETTWQMALAMAKSYVVNKFKSQHLSFNRVVGFVNEIDVGRYLGAANITIQTRFGFRYVQDFMGYDVLFILSDAELQRGRVIATPADNIVLYYVNPSDSAFARAGLNYRTVGNTPLIGVHIEGNYDHAVSDTFAIMGLTLFAEYIDGIAVVDVGAQAVEPAAEVETV